MCQLSKVNSKKSTIVDASSRRSRTGLGVIRVVRPSETPNSERAKKHFFHRDQEGLIFSFQFEHLASAVPVLALAV